MGRRSTWMLSRKQGAFGLPRCVHLFPPFLMPHALLLLWLCNWLQVLKQHGCHSLFVATAAAVVVM